VIIINRILKIFFSKSFLFFLIIGAFNTVVSFFIMYISLYYLNLGYWGSSSLAFFLASIISYFLNKKYSFSNSKPHFWSIIKFSIVIAVCYLVAFFVAKPIVKYLVEFLENPFLGHYVIQISLFTGQVIFTILNYFGQRFFAFKN
jgi:putative flippase GtrA